MRGFTVTSPDGHRTKVEATRYTVDENSAAVFFVDHEEQANLPGGEWERIDEFGTSLSADWPPDELDELLASLSFTLGATYGHYVHKIGDSSKYLPGYFNDLDALTAAILAAADVDFSSNEPEVPLVRETIAKAFSVRCPTNRVRPSSFMTNIHCPRCGDALYQRPGRRPALECRLGKMDLSEKASEWLRDFASSDPSANLERSTRVNWGGTWFCPADGYLMSADESQLPMCPSCHRIFDGKLIYALIEFQGPHT